MTREEAGEIILRGSKGVCKGCNGLGINFKGGEPVDSGGHRTIGVTQRENCEKCAGRGLYYSHEYFKAREVLGLPELPPRYQQ